MSYNVYLTDGNGAAVVSDGTLNNDYSVTLIGKGVVDYGSVIAQNSIHQLENFASFTPPVNPLIGQLWYNKSDTILYVFDGDVFYPLDKHLPTLIVDEFSSANITAGDISVVNLAGQNISFTHGNFYDLTIGNLLTTPDIHADRISAGNVYSNFTGEIGAIAPAPGTFTTLAADHFTGNISGKFNGTIGDLAPNTAAFTNVTADNITAKNYYGNLTGQIGQQGFRYTGSFSDLDADNITSRAEITGRHVTASQGFTGELLTNAQPNINSVGVLDNLTVADTTTTDTLVANTIVGIIATNSQPNINSVGNLNNLRVLGNTVVNTAYANLVSAHELRGTISTADQPLIRNVGTLVGLTVEAPIVGNLAGTADRAISANTAILADKVGGAAQPNITSLGNLTSLTVTGPVNLGNVGNLSISGGFRNQWLGINNAGHLYFGTPKEIPDYFDKSGYHLSNNGVALEWVYTDPALIKNMQASDIVTVTLPKNDPAHTPYTILNINMTDLISAEIYVQFYEVQTGDYYDGTIGISLFPDTMTYSVTPLSFGGPVNSVLQIHSADGSGWSGYPAYTDVTQIAIQVFNANIINGLSADLRAVNAIQWTWVHKFFAQNLITSIPTVPVVDGYIRENSLISTVAYTARAVDPDPGVTVTFSLKPNVDDEYLLAIDAYSGDVTLRSPAVYAVKNRYYCTVVAVNSFGLSVEKKIVIAVTRFDLAPVITSAEFVNIVENQTPSTVVYVATSSNPNFGSYTIYSIDANSVDYASFNIDPALGVLRLNSPAVYTSQQFYYVTIVATDAITSSSYDTLNLTVQVVKQPPYFV
jgi:hypothetical protein